jgi:hypothetical protein
VKPNNLILSVGRGQDKSATETPLTAGAESGF